MGRRHPLTFLQVGRNGFGASRRSRARAEQGKLPRQINRILPLMNEHDHHHSPVGFLNALKQVVQRLGQSSCTHVALGWVGFGHVMQTINHRVDLLPESRQAFGSFRPTAFNFGLLIRRRRCKNNLVHALAFT